MSASQHQPNRSEIDKCLQDAGVSDDLSFQEKLEFYNAIKVSESFSKDNSRPYKIESDNHEENENENENENIDVVIPITSLRRNKNNKQKTPQTTTNDMTIFNIIEDPLVSSFVEKNIKKTEKQDPEWQPSTSNNRKRKYPNTSQPDNAKRKVNEILENDINIFDCSTSQKSSLKRISIPLVYEKPFLYRKELDRMNFSDRLKTIYKYHFFLAQKYKQALQKSRIFIKWGKPVLPSHNFNGNLNKFETASDEENEDDEVIFFLSEKNTRVAQDDTDMEKSDTLKIIDNEMGIKENSSPISEMSTPNVEIEIDACEKEESRTENSTPNFDILKYNPACMTVPKKKNGYTGISARSEIMFDNFLIEEQKRIEQQLEVDRFVETLTIPNDEENGDFVSDKNSNRVMRKGYSDDDAFVIKETRHYENTMLKRRIIPPNPMTNKKKQGSNKKGISGKKTGVQIKPSNSSKRQIDENQRNATILRVKTPGKNKRSCPICRQNFSVELIQEHVEKCIESVESEEEYELNTISNIIKCDICDKNFKFNTDYEVHVNECIKKYKEP